MLTDTEIRKSKAGEIAYRLADGKGLYLFVTPAGGKLWRWKYRHGGKQKLMALGQYPDVPLVLARQRHAEARALLATGVDPMEQRKTEKSALKATSQNSFQIVAGLWLEHWRVGKSVRHADTTRRRMEKNIFPVLGARPIAEIEAPELVAMVKAIEARGVGDLAKRALETVGQIFRFAIAHGHGVKRNPATDVKPADVLKQTKKTNFARIDARELPGLLRAIECYRGKTITRLALKLMALTFVRTSELIQATWEEFDFDARRWNIPAERMKMKTPHIVPLATQTIEVLELLRTLTGGGAWISPATAVPTSA